MSIRVERLLDAPIIGPALHPSIGENIQGPSLIRVPEWVESPLGRYYLYFADHKGATSGWPTPTSCSVPGAFIHREVCRSSSRTSPPSHLRSRRSRRPPFAPEWTQPASPTT